MSKHHFLQLNEDQFADFVTAVDEAGRQTTRTEEDDVPLQGDIETDPSDFGYVTIKKTF